MCMKYGQMTFIYTIVLAYLNTRSTNTDRQTHVKPIGSTDKVVDYVEMLFETITYSFLSFISNKKYK